MVLEIDMNSATVLYQTSHTVQEFSRVQQNSSGALLRQVGNLVLTTLLGHLAECNFLRTLG